MLGPFLNEEVTRNKTKIGPKGRKKTHLVRLQSSLYRFISSCFDLEVAD